MACEACNAKFGLITRKKQCIDCKRHFCSECTTKRLDKVRSCFSCSMLSQRPLIKSEIVQMRPKDLRQYLVAKKVSIKGCIEKDDLVKLLISFANGTPDSCNTENAGSPSSDCAPMESYRRSAEISSMERLNDVSRIGNAETSESVSVINTYTDRRTDPIEEGKNPVKLSDINASSDLECLSVKQLKQLLSTNRVDYKGCVEKWDLVDRATMLWKEYKQSRAGMEVVDENVCKICWDEPIECVILECGHMACCLNCGKQMSECPICKQFVVRLVRFFKA